MADELKLDTNYTFFGDPKRQFPRVQDDNNIDVVEFLAASELMPRFFVHMGKNFMFVKSDVQQNVHKIKAAHEAYPECKTLKEILDVEYAKGVHKKDSSCSMALMWFRRGLLFMYLLLRQLVVYYREHERIPERSKDAANLSYRHSLRDHHNLVVRGLVTVAIKFLPTPTEMVLNLAFRDDTKIPKVIDETEATLDLLKPCLNAILRYYKDHEDYASDVKSENYEQCDAWQKQE
ncbi:glycolipid transfer protein-like [Lineus longissimus]|uniref:glycolipid transfer protein-like n=1 Tax=Lineus longissimus TaxID=88925 RepID=UPI002B4D4197